MDGRYFPVTVLGGRLYVDGIGERGPWNTGRLPYQHEAAVELLMARVGHRKVRSAEELRAILRESESGLPAIRAWVHEGIEEAARQPGANTGGAVGGETLKNGWKEW